MDEPNTGPTPVEAVIKELKWSCPECGKSNVVPIDEFLVNPQSENKASFVAGMGYNCFCPCGEEIGLYIPFWEYAALLEESQVSSLACAYENVDRGTLGWDALHIVDTVGYVLRKHRARMQRNIDGKLEPCRDSDKVLWRVERFLKTIDESGQ